MILAISFVGIVLRCAFPANIAVEHFDEGVYASNLWCPDMGNRYPQWHLYAPPLVSWAMEWSIVATDKLFARPDVGAPLLSLLAGCLTIPLVWWVGRSWFGPPAGLAAATLCSLSDFHIFYSRTSLTDVLLCFWLLIAVYLTWKTFTGSSRAWPVGAGIATGLAWWTKYNGWLPLMIGLAGLVAFAGHRWSRNPDTKTQIVRLVLKWCAIAVIAVGIWAPAYLTIEHAGTNQDGGYAEVTANHRKYFVGLAGWPRALAHQSNNHRTIDGWISVVGVGVFVFVGCFTWNALNNRQADLLKLGLLSLTLLIAAALTATSLIIAAVAVIGIIVRLRENVATDAVDREFSTCAILLCAAWFVGLLFATPLYTPYPRLSLPWLVSSWLAAAAGIGWIATFFAPEESVAAAKSAHAKRDWSERLIGLSAPIGTLGAQNKRPLVAHSRFQTIIGGGVLAALVVIAVTLKSPHVPGWEARHRFRDIASQIIEYVNEIADQENEKGRKGIRFVLYIHGEPGLFFHLSCGNVLTQPTSNLDFVHPNAPERPLATYLVSGPHAHRSDAFRNDLRHYSGSFNLLKTYDYKPSMLVRLNDAAFGRESNKHEVRLYRVIE